MEEPSSCDVLPNVSLNVTEILSADGESITAVVIRLPSAPESFIVRAIAARAIKCELGLVHVLSATMLEGILGRCKSGLVKDASRTESDSLHFVTVDESYKSGIRNGGPENHLGL
jgi:hypothetical protein